MTHRAYNFSAGPATLPLEVLEIAKEALIDFNNTGIGIAELSHRSPEFEAVIKECEQGFRTLLDINDSYSILFLGGGATLQFSMVPMNLLLPETQANFMITGVWAEKAYEEACKFGQTHIAASSKENRFANIPKQLDLSPAPSYLHFTSNNTIAGTQFKTEPEVGQVPLVCDASSDLLHKKIDVNKYSLIYAGAQKNLGPAGVTVVIIKRELLARSSKNLPLYLNYNIHAKNGSMYNTPPTFPIFVMNEVLKWVKKSGGLAEMQKRCMAKANILYNAIDNSSLFEGIAETDSRSVMNITFRIPDETIQAKFVKDAAENGFTQLIGHRIVGGLRASIYNAFPEQGVRDLVAFMQEFERSL